jgi:hypothetical protein
MKNSKIIKNFNDFVNENKKIIFTYETNKYMDLYLNGDINNEKLEESLYFELEGLIATTNEGIKDIFKGGLKSIQNWFFKILASTLKLVKTTSQKLINGIQSLVNTINKFKNKHPMIFKALAIIIIIMILIIISSSQAMANNTGDGIQHMMSQLIDISAGLVSDLKDLGSLDGIDIDSIGQGLEAVKEEILRTGDISGAINNLEGIDESAKKVIKIVIKEAGNYVGDDSNNITELIQNGKTFLFNYAKTDLNINYAGIN